VARTTETSNIKEIIDKMQAIDPIGAVVITSAGLAGLCGVQGPLSTIVSAFSKEVKSLTEGGVLGTLTNIADVLFWWNSLFNPSSSNVTPNVPASDAEKAALIKAIGMAAGNMVEAGLLYQLARNPETMQTLFNMSTEAVKGAVGLGKGIAAIAGV
jgi:hypothetical protein